jgi:hypothetical protein
LDMVKHTGNKIGSCQDLELNEEDRLKTSV